VLLIVIQYGFLMDATRILDGAVVQLKLVRKNNEEEADIAHYFSSSNHASSPRGRCVPILEEIKIDDRTYSVILVMPLLRRMDEPKFKTVGEVVECMRQIFEVSDSVHKWSSRDLTI
jgi:hypothetical protein